MKNLAILTVIVILVSFLAIVPTLAQDTTFVRDTDIPYPFPYRPEGPGIYKAIITDLLESEIFIVDGINGLKLLFEGEAVTREQADRYDFANYDAVRLQNANNVVISDAHFKGFRWGINIKDCEDIEVFDCEITHCYRGISDFNGKKNLFHLNLIERCEFRGVLVEKGKQSRVASNVILRVGSHHGVAISESENITVNNNQVDGNGGSGVGVWMSKGIIVNNNVGFNQEYGASLRDSEGVSGVDNYLSGNFGDTFTWNTDISGFENYGYIVAGLENNGDQLNTFRLDQNHPNPFNPTTTIRYNLPQATYVTLAIYNANGQKVATLVNEDRSAGFYQVLLNASNLPSGTYIARLETRGGIKTIKMSLQK